MDKKSALVTMILGLSLSLLNGQQLEYAVVNATETNATGSDGGKLIWTLGELMVEYYPNGAALDQGYLQSRFIITSVKDVAPGAPAWQLSVWPNPVSDQALNVYGDATLQILLLDVLGRSVLQTFCDQELIQLDLSTLPSGSYLLLAIDPKGSRRSVHVQKI